MTSTAEQYWVPHQQLGIAPCWLESEGNKDIIFRDQDKGEVIYPAADFGGLAKVIPAQLLGVDNVCTLEEVNQGALLHCVRVRYGREQVYTRVARILIALNPFKMLAIYSAQSLDQYRRAADSLDLPPHIYGIGLDAVNGLRKGESKNQAVLISGESGAGKTESTKLVLSYVAEALGGAEGGIQDRIMRTNPVLESFGNAMTLRNNNSSRFGKWLQITVSNTMKVQACSVVDYLLETTRVCCPGEKERNYHVFFQAIQAKKDDDLQGLSISEPQDYQYLRNSQFAAPGIDDMKCFAELKDAFEGLGYTREQRREIFAVIVGILNLGNVEFEEKQDAAWITSEGALRQAATALGLKPEELRKPIVTRRITVGKEVTEAKRNIAQAKAARDGLARLIYGQLFKWLIAGINDKLSQGMTAQGQFFGVLDIAGFESFEHNSLEQLFINLSNEHLQLHFNNHVFTMELEDYKAEGIEVANITFPDNSDVVALLDSKGAVLQILDEEVSMPKATDQTFLSKVVKAHESHKRLSVPKFSGTLKFGVRHFAGEVTYSCEGFLEKNVDKPPDEAPGLLRASSLVVLQEVGTKIAEELAEATGASGGRKKVKTVSSGFRASLASLVSLLNQAEPHFIRCVKPNAEKVPGKFTSRLVLEQLNTSGVFEAVRIRQAGFASRIPFRDFLGRFRILAPKPLQQRIVSRKSPQDDVDCVQALIEAIPEAVAMAGGMEAGGLLPGKSKVFAKTQAANVLEKARNLRIVGHAVVIQRRWRGHRLRKILREVKPAIADLKTWGAKNNVYHAPGSTALATLKTQEAIEAEIFKLRVLFEKVDKSPYHVPDLKRLEQIRGRMHNEVKALQALSDVSNSMEPTAIEAALSRAKDVGVHSVAGNYDTLQVRAGRLKAQVPIVKGMQEAMANEDVEQLHEAMERVKALGLHQRPEDWIEGTNGEFIAAQAYDAMERTKEKRKLNDIEKRRKQDVQNQLQRQVDEAQHKHETVLEKEEMKIERKRSRRVTISGLTEDDQEKIKESLTAACQTFSVPELERGLAEAGRQGVEPCETVLEAQRLFEQLHTQAFVTTLLQEKSNELADKKMTTNDLRCLQNLVRQASRLGMESQAVADAKAKMQEGVRHRVRSTIRGSIFAHVDIEEMQLMEGAFSNLANFPALKSPDVWTGHYGLSVFSWGERGEEIMLRHSKAELKEALTTVSQPLECHAVRNFHNLLGWMSDRPMPECQRLGYAQDVVETARMDPRLADEAYVQVMKQLHHNPSVHSTLLGWKVLLLLCQQICPSTALDDFLRAFLLKALRADCEETVATAKQCISDLNIITSPDRVKADQEELVPVQVSLIDHSTRKIIVPPNSTLAQVGEGLAAQLNISAARDFGFFQMTQGLEMHRLLPNATVLSVLTQKWARLKEATGRTSCLLYKRRFLRVDECLDPGDLMHATLTYRQALWDYLHYPLTEEQDYVCEVAANITLTDHDHFLHYVQTGRLHDPGVLEQLLPAVSLKDQKRHKWSTQVLSRLKALQSRTESDETRLMKMSRVISLLQRMRLFGSYWWIGRQCQAIPEDKEAIPGAPQQILKINPKEPTAEYWICVDLFGIRFVSVDSTPGRGYQRGFLFNEEAVERILLWGAKDNLLQFVISGVNPAFPKEGMVPMTIALTSPSAVDIAYTVHVIQRGTM